MSARWRAPGRVNLIGEHTDYNEGFAFPFALAAGCTATVRTRPDGRITVHSVQFDRTVEAEVADLAPGLEGWSAYVLGPAWVLRQRGHGVPGLDVEIDSDVPVGAGLSSSAALVCAVTTAVDELLGLGLDADKLLAVTRSVENDFVGAPTGGMDQLASLRCAEGHALLCDMRSLHTEQVPLALGDSDLTMLVVDSRAEHRHADGEYRARRTGCEQAAKILGVPALRDVDIDQLDAALAELDSPELRGYVRHIVTEDDRVLRVADLLRAGDVRATGPLLTESHVSMRDDYRITAPEVDLAVEVLLDRGAVGARMTGGGFGGCVIALFDPDAAEAAAEAVYRAYADRGFGAPAHFVVDRPGAGAHRMELA